MFNILIQGPSKVDTYLELLNMQLQTVRVSWPVSHELQSDVSYTELSPSGSWLQSDNGLMLRVHRINARVKFISLLLNRGQ